MHTPFISLLRADSLSTRCYSVLSYTQHINPTVCRRFQASWARVISGKDEGVYGWIALNYLTGHLTSNAGRSGEASEALGTVGAVDLGGSSLEVTFVPDQPSDAATLGETQHNFHAFCTAVLTA